MRVLILLRLIVVGKDVGSGLLLGTIGIVAAWLVGMLVTTSVSRMALDRFHLQTESFLGWSIQQVIPAMYNFENQFEFQPDQAVASNVVEFAKKTRQLNHFPLRIVTFFDSRYGLFHEGNGAQLLITSRYRGQQLITDWRVIASPNGLELKLVEKRFDNKLDPWK
jgi:hypothetical protein